MILRRYINSEILRTCVAILAVLCLIFISTRFIKYIQLAVDGTISSAAVFSLLALQLPAMAGFLLPLSFFIAILMTLGRLYSEHEMAVIAGVGVSEGQIARYILTIGSGVALLAAALSFFVNPWSSFQTKSLMAKEKAEAKFGAFSPGRFQENLAKTGVVFVESKGDDGTISGIFSVNGINQDATVLQIQTAKTGRFWRNSVGRRSASLTLDDNQELSDNSKKRQEIARQEIAGQNTAGIDVDVQSLPPQDFLVLEDGANFEFDRKTSQWRITEYDRYFMRVAESDAESISLKNRALSTKALLKSGQVADWAELHWRLAAPISIPILCFLAVPLARTQPRKGKFSRLFPAIMIYLAYALLMMNGKRLLEVEKAPIELGLWWVHAIAIGFCVWIYRPNKSRKKLQSTQVKSYV